MVLGMLARQVDQRRENHDRGMTVGRSAVIWLASTLTLKEKKK